MRFHSGVVVTLVAFGAAGAVSQPLALPRYSAWSPAINLGFPINSPFTETGVTLSKHGLSLYFSSNRPCDPGDAVADFNLWVAHRSSPEAPWEAPECLLINADARISGDAPYQDREPELSRDQHWLFFGSDRPGSLGPPVPAGGDIWVSWRANIFDDQGWMEPFNLTGLNTVSREGAPGYFENDERGIPQLFFTSTRSGQFDIWVTDVVNGIASGPARPVDEVNTDEFLEAGSSITHDVWRWFFSGAGRPSAFHSTSTPLRGPTSMPRGQPLRSSGPP
jgi:hypothetical protein